MNNDNGFLSQNEIDALLNGGDEETTSSSNTSVENKESVSDIEIDLLGEIGNISMGSAATTLSTILGSAVNITTPEVEITTLDSLKDTFEVPNIALEVKYTSGIVGGNLLVMKIPDAAVISNLMMGGDGKVEEKSELSEIEESAVAEAMNQMIGSAATSMATMFSREVNISPPVSKIWNDISKPLSDTISESEDIIKVSFKLTIGDLVDSNIMQILPIRTAKKIVSIMMGQEESEEKSKPEVKEKVEKNTEFESNVKIEEPKVTENKEIPQPKTVEDSYQPSMKKQEPVNIQKASFQPLQGGATEQMPKNIDLILDVPLEISVVLGKTKKSIKDVLSLGNGSLVELDKLAEEPVEIYVNGKKIAYGEVVVVDENFGVRIVNIVSNEERLKSLNG